jgi:cellulose synthase/poly-beta-1,6-N-acetylglucosamine synthase-like glycosyltransferase
VIHFQLTAFSFVILECLLALAWLWRLVDWLRNSPRLTDLTRQLFAALPQQPEGRPDLSVVVPACNEQASIAETLRSLLASEGIRLQILAVDDRSTDKTGSIMDAIAAEWTAKGQENAFSHSLEVIHIHTLPDRWLGKPHALAFGARHAKADWLLFTDGDILFDPQAAARALACAIGRGVDQLVLMPELILGSHGEAAMHGMMYSFSLWGFSPWQVEDPKSKSFLGVGAFNLMRRTSYESIGGFEALRMEVLEDMRLGWKVKRAGMRPVAVIGPGLASVRWAHGAWGVVRNTEKNLFSLYRFRTPVALAASFALSLQILLPMVALFVAPPLAGVARLAVLVHALAITGLYVATRRVTRVSPAYVVFFPFAVALFVVAHLRSVMLALVRGGILWRGTLYPLRLLREYAGSWK